MGRHLLIVDDRGLMWFGEHKRPDQPEKEFVLPSGQKMEQRPWSEVAPLNDLTRLEGSIEGYKNGLYSLIIKELHQYDVAEAALASDTLLEGYLEKQGFPSSMYEFKVRWRGLATQGPITPVAELVRVTDPSLDPPIQSGHGPKTFVMTVWTRARTETRADAVLRACFPGGAWGRPKLLPSHA